jgi:hypothetical protein
VVLFSAASSMADLFDDLGSDVIEETVTAPPVPSLSLGTTAETVPDAELGGPDASVPGDFDIKCHGLPWQTTPSDLESFFVGCDYQPGSATILYNLGGDGYIIVSSSGGSQRALAKHKETIAGRYVEVESGTDEEYQRAKGGTVILLAAHPRASETL